MKKDGQMVHTLKDNTKKVRKTEEVNISGVMELFMMVNGKTMKYMDLVNIHGMTAEYTLVFGK